MKKLWLILLCVFSFLFVGIANVSADDTEPEQATEDETITEQELSDKIQEYLATYVGDNLAIKIIEWLVDAGVLSTALAVWIKYRKYKHNTVEEVIGAVKNEVGANLKESFEKLSLNDIENLKKAIENLSQANETIMKVLVLMQDNTAKGKVALLDYLGSKTQSEEVKVAATETQVKIEEKIAQENEVLDKVSNPYEEIKF